jgi:lincosamide nucleotidyltransferase
MLLNPFTTLHTNMNPQDLLNRLDEIGQSLAQSGHALALIGLGSVGDELRRLDEYSDLDFFVIVEAGYKHNYIENLDWLSGLCSIAYHFLNSPDGYKLLFTDGIFCEFAVFEPQELQGIPFTPGRIVWKRVDAPETLNRPAKESIRAAQRDKEYLIGEAITNLYVGMGRDKRGEKLSAMRFIQSYAVDRLLELAEYVEPEKNVPRDIFANERRIEARHPAIAREMPAWLQGYERNRESALAILAFLESHFDVNEALANAIRKLCA